MLYICGENKLKFTMMKFINLVDSSAIKQFLQLFLYFKIQKPFFEWISPINSALSNKRSDVFVEMLLGNLCLSINCTSVF